MIRTDGNTVACFDIIDGRLDGGAEPAEFGVIFAFALLEKAKALVRIMEVFEGKLGVYELVKVRVEIDLSRSHGVPS